ncbi:MAG: alpha/beta hydrolase [Acidobacteriota bacterium]|nr:alpha/beta hydrolase [Acidobacteriota bacterium]
MVSPEGRDYLLRLRETPSFGANGFSLSDLRSCMGARREPVEANVECLPADAHGVPGQWVLAPGADPDLRLLYLHGGGFVSGCSVFYLPLAAHISAAANCSVFLPDYRLAPEHPYPAGLEDCIQAYLWLRDTGPSGPAPVRSIFISGDSAGGNLTLAVLLALRDRGLPLPQAGILLSPFADLTLSGDSIRSQAELDPIMHPKCLPDFVSLYADESELRDPLASPVFGDYTGLPPLLIQVGEFEVIRDDSVMVADRARACGVDVALEVWEGMFHVFQSHDPLLPEAREAIDRIAAIITAG